MNKFSSGRRLAVGLAVWSVAGVIGIISAFPGLAQTSDTTLSVTRLFPGQYDNTKYVLTLNDPQGLGDIFVQKANGNMLWSGSPRNGTPPCPLSTESGTVTLSSSDFPLSGYVIDCVNTGVQYTVQVSMPALPGDTATSSSDTIPPSTPTNVSAAPYSTSSIQIFYSASTDNVGVLAYAIFRNGVNIANPPYSGSYIDVFLSPGTSYSYTVAARDTSWNISAQSASVSATTLSSSPLTAPATPAHLSASVFGSDVNLYWQENPDYWNSTHTSESKLYRRLQGSSSWTLIYSRSVDTTYYFDDRYTDAGLASGTYEYRINFCNSAGCSPDRITTNVTVSAVAATTTSSLSPIGYWKFDGNGNNEIAGGPSAITVGSASFNSSGGKLGGYAYIPGSSDWLKIPYNSIFDLPDYFTIEFWFRQRADRSFLQNLVYKGTPTNNYNFYIYRQLWNQYNYGSVIAGHTAANTGFWTQPSNPNQLAHNEWHHVAFTKSPNYHAYYLDGALIGSKDLSQSGYAEYSGPAKTPHNDIIIGDSSVDTDMDNLRIYNRALSPDEVLASGGFAARVRVCEQGAKQCSGSNIQECSLDGYSWNLTQYCSYGCNSNTLSCNSAPTATSTTSTTTTASTPASSSTPPTTPFPQTFICPNGAIVPVGNTCPFAPTSTLAQPTSTPIAQCLQAGGLWCYSDYPVSLLGYCAPAKSACERGDQAPLAVLPQPPAVGLHAELQAQNQFLAERRAVLQDLRALERLVKRDIIEIDAKQLKIYKEKILSLKSGNEGDSSVLQAYRDQIADLQGDITTSSEREIAVDPRLSAGALKQLKQGLRLFERHIKTIEAKVTQIEKSGITVDAAIKETIASAKNMAQQVKNAKLYSDIQDIAEQMPDVGQALNDALPRLEELLRLPRVLRLVDRRIADGEKAIKQATASAKRLKLDAADNLGIMRGIITNAKSTVAAVKTCGATEGLLDTLQEQVFDPLDEIFDLAEHIRAVASVRQAVNQATASVKRYETRLRRLKAGSEARQTASELLGKFKEQLAGLKELSTQKLTADIGDQIIDNLNVMEDLKTELEDALGLSSPDAVQAQIKRLLSGSSEKIKPFKIEQLEQGVL